MAKFVKEKAFGGYKDVPGSKSDPEYTHVILKQKENEKLLREQTKTEQEARSVKYSAGGAIEEVKRDALYTAQKAGEKARKMVEAMEYPWPLKRLRAPVSGR